MDAVLHINSLDDRKMLVSSIPLTIESAVRPHLPSSNKCLCVWPTTLTTRGPRSWRITSFDSVRRTHLSHVTLLDATDCRVVYQDLPHPIDTHIGPEYAYRKTDGSLNNPCIPNLGKAGQPYSRSVSQTHPLPRNELPDSGLVFDTLLKREKVWSLSLQLIDKITHGCRKFVPHPAGLSSMMFSFAALVIHT